MSNYSDEFELTEKWSNYIMECREHKYNIAEGSV